MTQTSKVELGPEQKQVFDLAFPKIQEYAASNPSIFSGSGVAGFDPLEQVAQAGYVTQAAPNIAALSNQQAQTHSQMLNPDFMLNPNQYVSAAADAVTSKGTQNLMENILPQVRTGSTVAGGQYSGGATRQGVMEGKAIGDTTGNISNALADMYLKNYQTGLAGMSQAVNQTPQVNQQQLMPWDVLGAVGGQSRALEQAKLDEEIRKFYSQQDLPLLQSQQLLSLISGMPGGTGTTTVQGAAAQSNPLMQFGGLGLSLLGMMGGGGPLGMMGMGMK